MSNFILTGLFTEGTTDIRFLESIVKTTLENLALECSGYIETELQIINIEKSSLSFNQQVLKAAEKAKNDFGVLILFVHKGIYENTFRYHLHRKIQRYFFVL